MSIHQFVDQITGQNRSIASDSASLDLAQATRPLPFGLAQIQLKPIEGFSELRAPDAGGFVNEHGDKGSGLCKFVFN
jgi:hypothetical protein